MVTNWGMSESLGRVALSSGSESYLGEMEGMRSYSEQTARMVDSEIKDIIDLQYTRVLGLINDHREGLETIVRVLLERETLHAEEFAALMRGEELPEVPYEAPLSALPPAAPPSQPDKPSKGPLLPPGMMPKPG